MFCSCEVSLRFACLHRSRAVLELGCDRLGGDFLLSDQSTFAESNGVTNPLYELAPTTRVSSFVEYYEIALMTPIAQQCNEGEKMGRIRKRLRTTRP